MKLADLPGSARLSWLGNPTLRVGVLTGVYLSTVMIVALLAANRVPFLEQFADIRNWVFRLLFVGVALIPVGCFLRSPARLFAAGVCAWFLFALSYRVMGVFFENLFSSIRQTPFHAFVLGVVFYGVVAVACWVVAMVQAARQHTIAASRRRPY